MSVNKGTRFLYRVWSGDGRRCRGTTSKGTDCRAICSDVEIESFWPGVSDRCIHHVDEAARRDRELARIAKRSGAADAEALQPAERRKEIHRATQATRPRVKRSDPDPVESTSADDTSALGRVSSGS